MEAPPWREHATEPFRRTSTAIALVLAGILVAASLGQPVSTLAVPGEGIPRFGHVFLIIAENAEATELTPSNSPYLLGTLLPRSASLVRYYAVAHHSLVNYIAMTSGQYIPCDLGDNPPETCHQDVDSLFGQLDRANVSWQEWMESLDAPCSVAIPATGNLSDPYVHRHNPAIYYDDIEGIGNVWSATSPSAECRARVLPMGTADVTDTSAFDAALATGNVSRFNFIVPNICEDGHTACPPLNDRYLQFDRFLAREVPKVLASPAFGSDGLLIVTYDEGAARHFNFHDRTARGGRVLMLVLGPQVRPGSYYPAFDHYSLLRTLEDGFRLGGYLGAASRARPIDLIWTG